MENQLDKNSESKKYTKLREKKFYLKVLVQQCAILS